MLDASDIKTISLKRNDTSDLYVFNLEGYADLSSVNWVSSYSIKRTNARGKLIHTDTLNKTPAEDAFIFYIDPTVSAKLPLGMLLVTIQFENLIDYPLPIRKEAVVFTLNVLEEGDKNG